jgi:hypothetical protein
VPTGDAYDSFKSVKVFVWKRKAVKRWDIGVLEERMNYIVVYISSLIPGVAFHIIVWLGFTI